jgi:hypothetical protein
MTKQCEERDRVKENTHAEEVGRVGKWIDLNTGF